MRRISSTIAMREVIALVTKVCPIGELSVAVTDANSGIVRLVSSEVSKVFFQAVDNSSGIHKGQEIKELFLSTNVENVTNF